MKSIFKKMTLKRIGLVMALGMLMMVPGCGSKEAPATEAAKTEAAKEATADEKNAADSQASTAETINEAVENAAEKAEIPSSDSVSFIITLYPDKAPITCENFQKLVGEGFYNGISFHRVVDGIIAQAGDPTGTGAGGSSESIKGEFSSNGVDAANAITLIKSHSLPCTASFSLLSFPHLTPFTLLQAIDIPIPEPQIATP